MELTTAALAAKLCGVEADDELLSVLCAAAEQASSSISEAIKLAQSLPAIPAQSLLEAAKAAFIHSHSIVLATAGVLLLLLAAGIWRSLAKAPELN